MKDMTEPRPFLRMAVSFLLKVMEEILMIQEGPTASTVASVDV